MQINKSLSIIKQGKQHHMGEFSKQITMHRTTAILYWMTEMYLNHSGIIKNVCGLETQQLLLPYL